MTGALDPASSEATGAEGAWSSLSASEDGWPLISPDGRYLFFGSDQAAGARLYDMLPNFIVDWVDSTAMVKALHLPATFTVETPRGTMITQEWLINANAGLIVLCVMWVSRLVARMRRVTSIFIGITFASAGLIAPEGQKALYMGYANMPTAIG